VNEEALKAEMHEKEKTLEKKVNFRVQTVRNIQALDAAFNLYLQNQLSFQSTTTTTTREQKHEDER
jgi:hypothetical protein